MTTAIEVCSAALALCGSNPIVSFDDGTVEAELASRLYPMVRDAMLAGHPWGFATGQRRLALSAAEPIADYGSGYLLPADCLRIISAGQEGSTRDLPFAFRGQWLFASAGDTVDITYVARIDESLFPAYFEIALTKRLAAEFCVPLSDQTGRWQMLRQAAELELRAARLTDSQQHTPDAIPSGSLIEVR